MFALGIAVPSSLPCQGQHFLQSTPVQTVDLAGHKASLPLSCTHQTGAGLRAWESSFRYSFYVQFCDPRRCGAGQVVHAILPRMS